MANAPRTLQRYPRFGGSLPRTLGRRRHTKYPGDDLVAIRLVADPVSDTEAALALRVARAPASGASWLAIAEALASTVTEVRLRYDDPSWRP